MRWPRCWCSRRCFFRSRIRQPRHCNLWRPSPWPSSRARSARRLFGHFGDRIGRKATLVTALLTMGLSTVLIGCLPTYASIGVLAPTLLALCRFGQGLGLGGEWGGAVLLATENAPARQARLVRQLPAIRRAARLHLLERRVPLDEHASGQRGAPRLGLAHTLSRQRRAGAGRTLRALAAGRDSGVSTRHGARRAGAGAVRRPWSRGIRASSSWGRSGRSRLFSCSIS